MRDRRDGAFWVDLGVGIDTRIEIKTSRLCSSLQENGFVAMSAFSELPCDAVLIESINSHLLSLIFNSTIYSNERWSGLIAKP
jgi:hypothetical protein